MAKAEMKIKLNATPFEILSKHFRAYADVIEAARVLFEGYTAEDQNPHLWKTDEMLDYRLRRLFVAVEALDSEGG